MVENETINQEVLDRAAEIAAGNYLVDQFGCPKPLSVIAAKDQLRHELVRTISSQFIKLHKMLIELKAFAFESCDSFVENVMGDFSGNHKWIGNIIFLDYPQLMKIQIQVNRTIAYTEELNIAAEEFNLWADKRMENTSDAVQAMFKTTFNTDKNGNVSTARLLELVKMDVDDDEWEKIRKHILNSMMTVSGCRYIRLYTRSKVTDKWACVSLDFASL